MTIDNYRPSMEMSMRRLIPILCLVILLTSCAVPSAAPNTPSLVLQTPAAATSTLPPPATVTPVPTVHVIGRTVLSPSPNMNPCGGGTVLTEDAAVTVTGSFKDYAAVQAVQDGKATAGFLPKVSLSRLPPGMQELSLDEVPWKSVVDYRGWSFYSPEDGGSIVSTPAQDGESDWVNDASHHPVQAPMKIHFGLKSTSTRWAGVRIMGTDESSGEWWQGIIRMDVFTGDGTYHLGFRDGASEAFTTQVDLPVPAEEEITLIFTDANGKQIQVANNADQVVKDVDVTTLPDTHLPDGLFPNGWFQFGTTIGPPGTLKVTHLSITSAPDGIYQKSWTADPGLAELARSKGIWIGTEFNPDMMLDERYCAAVQHDFNLAYLSGFTDGNMWLAPGKYNFTELDRIVNATAQRGLTIYASHLVWGAYEKGILPDWLKNSHYSKSELLKILEQHVKTLAGRYKDQVSVWSIANESPERDVTRGADFWYDHIGPEYVEKAFQWAREADPDGILILNADNNESPRDADTIRNIDTLYTMVKTMKAKGVPVDAVGMQAHLFLPWKTLIPPAKTDVVATMRKFGSLGVKVMITEMDVNLHELQGTPEEKQQLQTRVYHDMMAACLESGVCTAFSTWGVGDAVSWVTCDYLWCVYPKPTPDAAPLMFDENYQPKPAYFGVRDALMGK